ncbi:MAG TPA: serine hydrolase [Granulicella sp.]|nr:serine hydrolase [Granulicella sp.]
MASAASAPASLGFDAAALARLDADISAGKYGHVDSLLILRHGKTTFDHVYQQDYRAIYGAEARKAQALNGLDPGGASNYFNPWWYPYYRNQGQLHTLQSVTKTVDSIIIGIALTRGEFPSIDTPVLKFFDAGTVANVDDRKRHLTIRHLLNMTTGVTWNSDVPYSDASNSATQLEESFDWQKYFIDQPMAEEPGTHFNYNDGAPQALAYIFRKATGQDLEEYAAEHLFAPLGITSWFWKRTPQGVPDGEGGLYLDRHDLAKLMLLYLHNGAWNGTQIVSPEWVKASLTPAIKVEDKEFPGRYYAYLWWFFPYGDGDSRLAFGGAGFGGQRPLVLRDEDIVIVANGWNILDGSPLSGEELTRRIRAALVHPEL